jgi:hypothetical protein
MRPSTRFLAAIALLAGANHFASASVTVGNSNVQIGGFFSQGYLKSSKNNYPFEAKDGTWDFREMAVNVSTTFGSHLRLGAQGFAQRLGNYGEDKIKLDWAVADYNFRQEIGVRAGRIKYPKGLYGEALDVDAIRPFIFLPSSLYNPVLRDFSSSFDGAMVYGTLSTAKAGSVDYKVFYGDIAMNTDQGVADFFNDTTSFAGGVRSLEVDHVKGAALDWSTPLQGLKLHLSYSQLSEAQGRGPFAPVPVLPLLIQVSIDYTTVGAEYTYNDWTFAAEWQDQSGESLVQALPAVNSAGDYGSKNYYVSVARRLGQKWELGAYFSKSENKHPSATTPEAQRHLDDLAFSVRYNVNENVILKAEYHSIDGRYNVFNTARTPNPTRADSTSFWAVKSTFVF